MHPARVVALALDYPGPSSRETLAAAVASVRGPVRRHVQAFVDEIGRLTLGEWEELHTRTLDLSPLFVPYVGHVVWGENYRRGEFMAALKGAMAAVGVDPAGELPDHLEPVLRYLAATDSPLGDLVAVLPGAVDEMSATLARAERRNPYRHVLAAAAAVVEELATVEIGVRR